MRIFIKGKEITNPFVRLLVGMLALAVFVLLLLLFLPLLGITLALALSVVIIAFAAVIAVASVSLLFALRKTRQQRIKNKKDY